MPFRRKSVSRGEKWSRDLREAPTSKPGPVHSNTSWCETLFRSFSTKYLGSHIDKRSFQTARWVEAQSAILHNALRGGIVSVAGGAYPAHPERPEREIDNEKGSLACVAISPEFTLQEITNFALSFFFRSPLETCLAYHPLRCL